LSLLPIKFTPPTINNYRDTRLLSTHEFNYISGRVVNYRFVKNYPVTPFSLSKLSNIILYPSFFNFNIDHNLFLSKQQRWLTRNTLLNSSIVNNSFLITQSKKLLGQNVLNHNMSTASLWLPTKFSNNSSFESYLHLNNLSTMFNTVYPSLPLLKANGKLNTVFTNLNFFENSRYWVFKKYFFTNQQSSTLAINTPKINFNNNMGLKNTLDYTELSILFSRGRLDLINVYNIWCTPSLKLFDKTFSKSLYIKNTTANINISLNLPNLDITNDIDLIFLLNLTSNPQNYKLNTTIITNHNNLDYNISSGGDYLNIFFKIFK
jgi:hypothetical protein